MPPSMHAKHAKVLKQRSSGGDWTKGSAPTQLHTSVLAQGSWSEKFAARALPHLAVFVSNLGIT
jgi:hypothetical protein